MGLDIGTTKVCAIIGEQKGEGQVEIAGIGVHSSSGLKKGVIVNIEATVESIKAAVKEAELMAGVSVESVYVGVAGNHIKGANSNGVVAIKNSEVDRIDIQRVLDTAQAINRPTDQEVIHILLQEYIIDGQDGIKDPPLGISGTRLESKIHIISGATSSIDNINKCVEQAGFAVNKIVLEPLASSEATLTQDERELGVILIDIGGGTTDIQVFTRGSVKHTAVIGLGGNNITRDIAIVLRTLIDDAERIKKYHGCACSSLILEDEMVEVLSIGGRESRQLPRKVVSEIVEPRVEEIFRRIDREIQESGYKDLLASGAVITGGSSLMEGILEIAEEILELPVRRGISMGIKGWIDMVSNPMYATGVGLVLYGLKNGGGIQSVGGTNGNHIYHVFRKMAERSKKWLEKFF